MSPAKYQFDEDGHEFVELPGGGRGYVHRRELDDEDADVLPPPTAPMAVARVVTHHHHTDRAGALLQRWWRGSFYRHTGGRWLEVEDKTVRSALYRRLEHAMYEEITKAGRQAKPWDPNRYKVSDLTDALAAVMHTDEHLTPPAWLERHDGDPPAGELVAVANGLLHVPTRRLLSHTPRLWNHTAVPFGYEPDAPEPATWLEFLDELWADDADAIEALQEWFGYVVSGDTSHQKIMFIVGPMRSGKGTIARVLTALVGRPNVTGPTLGQLGQNFGLQDLIGKQLAVISDARVAGNASVIVERLLSISGEDTITIDRKYRDPWTGQLRSRLMVISNELPNFGDASGAIVSRLVTLTLRQSWLGQEDHTLTTRLLDELPGILNWALEGLDRLRQQDHFTEPASSRDAITALHDLVSPVSAFVRDCCATAPANEIPVDVLYQAWKSWCMEQGGKASSAASFGKELRAAVPGVRKRRPRAEDGDRIYRYVGICLNPQWASPRTNQDHVDNGESVHDGPRSEPLLSAEALVLDAFEGAEVVG